MSTDLIQTNNRQMIEMAETSYAKQLTSSETQKHTAWISVRVEALLDGYWQTRPADLVKKEIIADWISALMRFSQDEIREACRDWMDGDNRRKKPQPGDIADLCNKFRWRDVKRAFPDKEKREIEYEEPTDDSKQRVQEMVDKLVGAKRAN